MSQAGYLLSVPYGSGRQEALLDPGRPVTVLAQRGHGGDALRSGAGDNGEGAPGELETILAALAAPVGSPPLRELARGKRNVVVLTSDHTRPVPSSLTLPAMLAEIREGSPAAEITVLIGTGCHRGSTREEITAKFGEGFARRERILNHDPSDEEGLVSLGRLPSGGELRLSRLAASADLLAADGFIEPHQFAGFSGGPKSVLPGVAAFRTVLASHNAEFTVHPKARPGSLDGNPFQRDMLFAARKAGLAFILNVTLDGAKRVSGAYAGDPERAHRAGCAAVLDRCGVKAAPAPVVVTSNGGYPLDQNVYQSTKSIMQADLTCAEGGVIVAVNECRDGHGSLSFLDSFRNASSLDALLAEIESRGREDTVPDQWVIQLTASILRRRRVIMVTEAPRQAVEDLGMTRADSLSAALGAAGEILGDPLAPVTVLPDAVSVVIS
ncbi:MAG: nickel-dependent lactate racemase [Deltaproteobacteria bacterium]|jgi:nickel-dependent lactate racemase|nr:nickel-dependent lactate racemase [Deltaproteobacteria bacterium]